MNELEAPEIVSRFQDDKNSKVFENKDGLFNYIATQLGPLGNYDGLKAQAERLGLKLPFANVTEFNEQTEKLIRRRSHSVNI